MIRIITISREYGSGGGAIGRLLAGRLSWKLLDASLISEIARAAEVDPALAEKIDESTDPWFFRVVKAVWQGGYEGGGSTGGVSRIADADTIAAEWHRIILEAAAIGDCIIIGHGSQCILQDREDCFHVSVYAPMDERIERIRQRARAGSDPRSLAEEFDRRRSAYIRRHFKRDWTDRHLYNLLVCSSIGMEKACELILSAAGLETRASQK